jgi:hypothetical protein
LKANKSDNFTASIKPDCLPFGASTAAVREARANPVILPQKSPLTPAKRYFHFSFSSKLGELL